MSKHMVDPLKVAEILGLKWEYGQKYDFEQDKEIKDKEVYHIILSEVNGQILSDLYVNFRTPNFVSVSAWDESKISSLIAFYNITNVIYKQENFMIIIESIEREKCSVLEIKKVKDIIDVTLKSNLDREYYERNFKNY